MFFLKHIFLLLLIVISQATNAAESSKPYSLKDSMLQKANAGDLEYIFEVGYSYYYGASPFRKNDKLAYEYLYLGSEKGSGKSANLLGIFFQDSKNKIDNQKKAAICFIHAASLKNYFGTLNLAAAFWNGDGVEQDYSVAYALYEVAATLDTARSYQTRIARNKLEKK